MEMGEGSHERVLNNIFGQHGAADFVPDRGIEAILISARELLVSPLFSKQGGLDQLAVGNG